MSIEKRIKYFKFIRDIPYKIGLDGEGDYCCATKAYMLADLLEGLGLKTRQIICTFDWNDTPIPQNILDLPWDDSDVTHQFMQVFIPENKRWVNCDPTWDRALEYVGFNVEDWDGLTDTGLAVNSINIYSPEQTLEYKKKWYNKKAIDDHYALHGAFYNAINAWMHEVRK